MTIEQLLEYSPEQLKAMSDAVLLEHFQKYLTVTRPELATKPTKTITPEIIIDPKKKAAMAMLAAEGIDMSFMRKKKYR